MKKSSSTLFSDEEDLFETSAPPENNAGNSLWDQEPPPLDFKPKSQETKTDLFSDDGKLFSSNKTSSPREDLFKTDDETKQGNEKSEKSNALFPEVSDPLSSKNDDSPLFSGTKSLEKASLFSDDDSDPLFSTAVATNIVKTSKITSLKSDDKQKPKLETKPKKSDEGRVFNEGELFQKKSDVRKVTEGGLKFNDPLFSDETDQVPIVKKPADNIYKEESPHLFEKSKR